MFNIRLANEDDIKKVYDLSNDEIVRNNSINKNKIEWENHIKWFSERIKNIDEPFYIVEDENKNFIAQVRFNKEDDGFVISVSIEKNYRGKGLGGLIILEATEKLEHRPVIAYVKKDNIPSQKSFLKAGYKLNGNKIFNDEIYFVYLLN